MESGANVNRISGRNGWTPLMDAIACCEDLCSQALDMVEDEDMERCEEMFATQKLMIDVVDKMVRAGENASVCISVC